MEDRPPHEAELVARAKRGERDAYEEIVRRHQNIAFRTAWVITGSAADAEEAAQDAFVKAHRALGRFREGAPLRPWLLTIVANEARNRVRAAGRRERLVLRVAEERRPGGAVPSPEAALLDFERRDELLAAVAELPETDRQAIACRYFLDLSEEETAAALGCRAEPSNRGCRGRWAGCASGWRPAMPELERMLTRLGEELDWPPTPDLAAGVMPRLDEERRRSRPSNAPVRGAGPSR